MKGDYKESTYASAQNGSRETPSLRTNRRRAPSNNTAMRTSDSVIAVGGPGRGLTTATNSEQSVTNTNSWLDGFM